MAELVTSLKGVLTQTIPIWRDETENEPLVPPSGSTPEAQRANPQEQSALTNTIRVSAAKLDAVLLQAEEMLSVKFNAWPSGGGQTFPNCSSLGLLQPTLERFSSMPL